LVWGERWHAASEDGQKIEAGEKVQVIGMKGFELKVKRVQ
jgi:membrane-bound ClpP family serine protease